MPRKEVECLQKGVWRIFNSNINLKVTRKEEEGKEDDEDAEDEEEDFREDSGGFLIRN